jgi:transposase
METILTNFQWAHLAPLLPGWEGTNSKHGRDNRQFVEAEFWLARDGARWRALHKERGNWHTMYKHSAGLPQACGNARSKPYRTKLLCTCSWSTQPRCERTSTRAGRTKKHRKPSGTAAAGQRVRCIWTVTPAAHRPSSRPGASAGYPWAYEAARYAQRHLVERLFTRLKQFRRVASRYSELDRHFLAFIHLAATVPQLRNC